MRQILVLVLACTLAACGTTADLLAQQTEWSLRTIDGAAPAAPASLTLSRDQLRLDTGCNTGTTTSFELADGALRIDGLGLTERACAPELMAQEAAIAATIADGARVLVDGDTLTITAPDGSHTLVLVRARGA